MEVKYLEEKMSLADELGMRELKESYERLQEAAQMHYPTITERGVEQLIHKNLKRHPASRRWCIWKSLTMENITPIVITTLLCFGVGFITSMIADIEFDAPNLLCVSIFLGLPLLGFMVSYVASSLHRWFTMPFVNVVRCHISEWSHDTPRGALLAVKEAKASGLDNFSIWYPTERVTQRAADPVITAFTPQENRVMIFAWDEGLIYSE